MDPWAVLSVRGEVDLSTAPSLRSEISQLVDAGRTRVVVDLEGVPFMDSSGLGVLVMGLKRARERDGDLALVRPQPQVRRLLSITRLDEIFAVHATVADAVGA